MKRLLTSLLLIFLSLAAAELTAQENDVCFDCHDDPELTGFKHGKEISMNISPSLFAGSVHKDNDCIDCHEDANDDHDEDLQPVYCGDCHDDAQEKFEKGVHGIALARGDLYAPTCQECHGKHDILPHTNVASRTYKMKIPVLCGKCHREGAPVARVYNISEHNILENYTQSIHGAGLFKKGLVVSATCNNCHGNHLILPHTSSNSSISLKNIAKTCMSCHARIEEVHTKVIKGELWEEKPGAIPACTDCHPPHKVNRQNIVVKVADRTCLKCHNKPDIIKTIDGDTVSLRVDREQLNNSMHREITCVKCHSDVSPQMRRPCATARRVDCSNCHAAVADQFFESGHGQAYFKRSENAPYCTDCHGDHEIKSKYDDTSLTYRAAIPTLCGECHKAGGKAAKVEGILEINAITDYSQSVHGRGLEEKGLLPSAVCTDCHTSHHNLKANNPASSVYDKNIPATCAACHKGIYEQYTQSIHYIQNAQGDQKLPTCEDCHSAHQITDTRQNAFMRQATVQCGNCHRDLTESFLETIHGKTFELGSLEAAKCSDCHGAHDIRTVNDPESKVGPKQIVYTCQQCHENANERFTGYLTHATHHDKTKYPVLFYTYWIMTTLLISVFAIFGIHTVLWLPKSIQTIREHRKARKNPTRMDQYYIRRFTLAQRFTHLFVILSFISLAFTGMILKFSGMAWAKFFADLIGVHGAGLIHRAAAIVTFGYFFFHLYNLFKLKRRKRTPLLKFIFGPNSMMFNKQDFKDFIATVKWFFGKGPKPSYGRWTYWEKFDYFAVFWGVAVIGLSGLILWLPEYFTNLLPGWLINVVQIIHSDEALLAVGFIFTIHFFNTHLRPDAFPMDTVIFTGMVSLEEFRRTRPREYQELKESGKLGKLMIKKEQPRRWEKAVKFFGSVFLILGIILIVLILYSAMFGYN